MEKLFQIRHRLHRNAGLSGDESFAHDCIEEYLNPTYSKLTSVDTE